ncbi:MAG: muropeptide transporter AmpG [Gammaproteobacteria bacterium]|nr:muropeptide transporter AmpG [Gammaproteobacteria bacterium]
MADADINIKTIGLFTLAQIPYVLKFLWAPLMDRYAPPGFDHRRSWILVSQLFLIIVIVLMALSDPHHDLEIMGLLALLIAFLSASQDIAFDAYRTDLLNGKERGMGAGISVSAYRIAMLVSGAGVLIMADHIGWQAAFLVISALFIIGITGVFYGPNIRYESKPPATLSEAVVNPFQEFLQRDSAWLLLIFIVLYKLGDAFAGSLTTVFLISDLGFSLTDVGLINKVIGLIMTVVGALLGGGLMIRIGLFNALLWFGLLQALTNLGFMFLAISGKSYAGAVIVIAMENLAGGMGTAAFVALLMALCNHRYTATQFALLSALAAVGRVFVGPPSGQLVALLGWADFFFITFLTALPGICMLFWIKPGLDRLNHNHEK